MIKEIKEIQEIKIDGVTYTPINDKYTGSICDECALNGKCVLIDIPELDERINPCGLFGSNKSLEVKDSVMSRHVSLPLWHSCNIENVKPYLFPLSSMTENQKEEFNDLTTSIKLDLSEIGSAIDYYNMDIDINEYSYVSLEDMLTCIDWLNSHHFDYRGLIDKGLAIDTTGLNIY